MVDSRRQQFEMAMAEELRAQLEEERETNKKLQEDVDIMRIWNELEIERLKKAQWSTAIDKLKEAREQAEQEHEKCMEEIQGLVKSSRATTHNDSLEWLKVQLNKMPQGHHNTSTLEEDQEKQKQEQAEKEAAIADLTSQQDRIAQQLAELRGTEMPQETDPMEILKKAVGTAKTPQENMMQQLRNALSGKKEEDNNKTLLKALANQQNRTAGEGGTNTLKTSMLKPHAPTGNSMADWLAQLNKQDEGESDLNHLLFAEEEGASKQTRFKSGILDQATTNIQQKQVWPQQNLGEDWADEDVEFRQVRFEHMVAGETRTIETCTDPAEILGRL